MESQKDRTATFSGVERAVVIVLDGVGVGALPDAAVYGDAGADTLGHVAEANGGLRLRHLEALGLGALHPVRGLRRDAIHGAWGRMAEASAGKDTAVGHWELMGVESPTPFPVFPTGFPAGLVAAVENATGRRMLGNKSASGTEILEEYGARHLQSGDLILYTSVDSVMQLAAHEEIVAPAALYEHCRQARAALAALGVPILRVIARPFRGAPGSFARTYGRKDFSLPPPRRTILEELSARGWPVLGIGKIGDIFSGRGINESRVTQGNRHGLETIATALGTVPRGLIFANLIDFDMLFGHRNDARGFAAALEECDSFLGERVLPLLRPRDLLFITADHGCDPATAGTDHTREYVPLLVGAPWLRSSIPLGIRRSHADLAATIHEALTGERWNCGESFWSQLRS